MTCDTSPVTTVTITPSYSKGLAYSWTVSKGFEGGYPWKFVVEEGKTVKGPWKAISPELENKFTWSETELRCVPKDSVLAFRIKTIDASGKIYYSHTKDPYGDLGRREFLLAREMMRKEALQMRKLSGTQGQLWIKSIFGPPCTECLDPITKDVLDADCEHCFGTGHKPGYHGPYTSWMTFSPKQRNKHMPADGKGLREDYKFQVRMLGLPRVKKDDVLIDTAQGKCYYVSTIVNTTELRRIPVVQTAGANETPVTDAVYKLGQQDNAG